MIDYINKYWGGWNSDIYKRGLDTQSTNIIMIDGDKAGFFVFRLNENAHIANIQLSTNFQNRGIGHYVLNLCESKGKDNGFSELYLEVFLNNPARILYERCGFKTYKTTESHYKMKKIIVD